MNETKSFPPVPNLPEDIRKVFNELQESGFSYANWVRDTFRATFMGKDVLLKMKQDYEKKLKNINERIGYMENLKIPNISPMANNYLYIKVLSKGITLTNIEGQLEVFNRNYPDDKLTIEQFRFIIEQMRLQNETRI
jgi:hypothetical protein